MDVHIVADECDEDRLLRLEPEARIIMLRDIEVEMLKLPELRRVVLHTAVSPRAMQMILHRIRRLGGMVLPA